MKVCKFGGSSVADAAQINKVCDIMTSDRERRVIVVSAPGKRSKSDTKMTDMLINCAERAMEDFDVSREQEAIVQRFSSIISDLGLDAALAVQAFVHAHSLRFAVISLQVYYTETAFF